MFTSYSKLSTAFLKHWIEVLLQSQQGQGPSEMFRPICPLKESPVTLTGVTTAAQEEIRAFEQTQLHFHLHFGDKHVLVNLLL